MSPSIYTVWHDIANTKSQWKEALDNWLAFLDGAGQIVIFVDRAEEGAATLIRKYVADSIFSAHPTRVDVVETKGLAHCVEPYIIRLNCDDRLIPSHRRLWGSLIVDLEMRRNIDGFEIPVIVLGHDEQHYQSIDSKPVLSRTVISSGPILKLLMPMPPHMIIGHLENGATPFILNVGKMGEVADKTPIFKHNLLTWRTP